MAATVVINRLFGAGPTACLLTSASAHAGAEDAISPCAIQVPSSGSNYSYWVTTQLECTVAPDNALNNIKWYSDGTNSLGTGIDAIVATASSYVQATGTAASSGILLSQGNHAGLTAPSPLFMYTTACKLGVSGSLGAATGALGDRVVWQINVEPGAAAGNTGEETFTFQWDES